MKKYDLSKIMKRAWELVKKAGMKISSALKISWREEKLNDKKELPELTGSEKLINWANAIREKALELLDKVEYPYLKEVITTQSSACYFIDNFRCMTFRSSDEYKISTLVEENLEYIRSCNFTIKYRNVMRAVYSHGLEF